MARGISDVLAQSWVDTEPAGHRGPVWTCLGRASTCFIEGASARTFLAYLELMPSFPCKFPSLVLALASMAMAIKSTVHPMPALFIFSSAS